MAKSLVVGPNSVTAKTAGNLSDFFNSTNCVIVYQADGSYKSWVPGRALNAITAFEQNSGYIIIMKEELDVENLLDITDNFEPNFFIFNGSTEALTINATGSGSNTISSSLNPGVGSYGLSRTNVTAGGFTTWNFVSTTAGDYVIYQILLDNNGQFFVTTTDVTTAGTGSNNPSTGAAQKLIDTLPSGGDNPPHDANTIYVIVNAAA